MNHLDLFTGIMGFSIAAHKVWGDDYNLVACCEIDEFCQKVIRARTSEGRLGEQNKNVPIISDIRDVTHETIMAGAKKRINADTENGNGGRNPGEVDGEAQGQKELLKRKALDTAAALKREQAAGASSDQVVAYHAYLNRLSGRIAKQTNVVNAIKERESKKQEALLEAMKKRQILDKLKDQGLDRYNQIMLKKEMNFIDEIAVNQFVRKTIQKSGEGQ